MNCKFLVCFWLKHSFARIIVILGNSYFKLGKCLKSGTVQYIVVYMFDRFARNRRDSIMYKEMPKEEGIKVLSALEPIAEDERARRKV